MRINIAVSCPEGKENGAAKAMMMKIGQAVEL
jgi:hypothetical protein